VVAVLSGFPALSGLDLEIAQREVALLRGPNGAGKSTVLRLCAGLVPLESGTASVLGHDVEGDVVSVRRKVGILGHQTNLYEDLTVADNLKFWSSAARAPKVDLASVMDRVGLERRLGDVRVGSLSAGQRRRTAMAVLVARRPRLWLLDEPHAGLDQAGRDLLDGLVAEAVQVGVTVVMASHDHDRALAIATCVVDLAGGMNLAQVKSPESPTHASSTPGNPTGVDTAQPSSGPSSGPSTGPVPRRAPASSPVERSR